MFPILVIHMQKNNEHLYQAEYFISLLMIFAHVLWRFSLTTLGTPIKHVNGCFTSSSRLRLQRHTAPQASCSLPSPTKGRLVPLRSCYSLICLFEFCSMTMIFSRVFKKNCNMIGGSTICNKVHWPQVRLTTGYHAPCTLKQ